MASAVIVNRSPDLWSVVGPPARRLFYSSSHVPSASKPLVQHGIRDAGFLRPFKRGEVFTSILIALCFGPVALLFTPGSPFAVSGLVWLIVILSVYAVGGRWSIAHILDKIGEAIPPSVAYSDTSPPIVGISVSSGVVTPRFHRFPYAILFRPFLVYGGRCAMSEVSCHGMNIHERLIRHNKKVSG